MKRDKINGLWRGTRYIFSTSVELESENVCVRQKLLGSLETSKMVGFGLEISGMFCFTTGLWNNLKILKLSLVRLARLFVAS